MPTRIKTTGRRLAVLTVANAAMLALLWVLETLVGERHWLSLLLAYLPQPPCLLATLMLTLAAVFRRDWPLLGLNLAVAALAVYGLLGFRWSFPTQAFTPTVRILSYNVNGWEGGEGAIEQVIRQTHPDVICLQEAEEHPWRPRTGPPQAPVLRQHFPGYHFVSDGPVMLGSRFPLTEPHIAHLTPERDSRPIVSARISVDGHLLTVMTTHLTACQYDRNWSFAQDRLPTYLRANADLRERQVSELLAPAHTVQTPLVICGDLNTPAAGRLYSRLTQALPDAFDGAGRGLGATIPSSFPVLRLDHLLASRDLRPTRVFVPATRASDHRPLVTDLAFR